MNPGAVLLEILFFSKTFWTSAFPWPCSFPNIFSSLSPFFGLLNVSFPGKCQIGCHIAQPLLCFPQKDNWDLGVCFFKIFTSLEINVNEHINKCTIQVETYTKLASNNISCLETWILKNRTLMSLIILLWFNFFLLL